MGQFGNQLNQWDKEYYQPLMASVGSMLTSIGSEGILKPIINIATTAVSEVIRASGAIQQCCQEVRSKVRNNQKRLEVLEKMNEQLMKGIENMNGRIVHLVTDFDEPINVNDIREVYKRIQILNALGKANNCLLVELTGLDQNFKLLLEQHSFNQKMLEG